MKKSFARTVLVAATLFAACVPAFAGKYDSWPEKDIHILYYTRPGSGGDTFLRNMAVALKNKMNGHSIVIENLVDPSGATPWGRVQRAPKDGYTLACLSDTVVTADLLTNSPVKYEDFDYVCGLVMEAQYLYARKDTPYNTLPELVTYAKANPGKVNWGLATPSATNTICSAEVIRKAGLDVNRITFATGGDILVNILGGFADVGVGEYIDMRPQVEAGNIKLIALMADARNSLNVPTAVEYGYEITFDRPRGLAAPKGTDPELVARMAEFFKQVYESKSFMNYVKQESIDPVFQNGDQFLATYKKTAKTIEENKETLLGKK